MSDIRRRKGSVVDDGVHNLATKTSSIRRTSEVPGGVFLATVMDDVDPLKLGRVWAYVHNVSKNSWRTSRPPDADDRAHWHMFMPVLPFFGSDDLLDPQGRRGFSTSYGFWAQPRIGNTVAVVYTDMKAADGFYIGSVPKINQNFMVPGTPVDDIEGEDQFKLPGTEKPDDANTKRKNRFNLATHLKESGLQNDPDRGGSDSGARRESPSRVIGLKTPGDPASGQIGHSLTFDDAPTRQSVRVRSSRGNQVFISDSGQYINISTARGQTWLEIREDGNVDLYAAGDISLHAGEDFNFFADRDINMSAGRDMNLSVGEDYFSKVGGDEHHTVVGDSKKEVTGESHLKSTGNMRMDTAASFDQTVGGAHTARAGGEHHVSSIGTFYIHSNATVQTQAGANTPTTATSPLAIREATVSGAPSAQQVASASPGSSATVIGGRSGNARVPQHEPWGRPNSSASFPVAQAAVVVPSVRTYEAGDLTGDITQDLWQTTKGDEGRYPYVWGGKRFSSGAFNGGVKGNKGAGYDCSGWVQWQSHQSMKSINNKFGEEVFSQSDMNKLNTYAAAQIDNVAAETGVLLEGSAVNESNLKEGMIIGIDSGVKSWDGGRARGIDHIAQVVKDPVSGNLYVSESRSGAGVSTSSVDKFLTRHRNNSLYATDPYEMATGGRAALSAPEPVGSEDVFVSLDEPGEAQIS